MMTIAELTKKIKASFKGVKVTSQLSEITINVSASAAPDILKKLKHDSAFQFKQLIDLCGVDYKDFPQDNFLHSRYAVVYHLLSIQKNIRIRLKAFIQDNDYPKIESICDLFNNANWYEREAFDLFGIMFLNHPDLRRILTDYGFIGHPFRKDFPVIGEVEMRYDPGQKRVIYEPVSIDLRNNVPRTISDLKSS
ncbi:MAG: NADH-quinone oxidoreductase subunit C [Nitrosomonadales bacterium]|jgi:NADH-quinone oxidoreductase subunit C